MTVNCVSLRGVVSILGRVMLAEIVMDFIALWMVSERRRRRASSRLVAFRIVAARVTQC